MRPRARWAAAFAIALAGPSLAPSSRAQAPSAPDEDALRHGVQLRRELRDAEALAEFQRAYALKATARARAQIALAEQALGRWADAEVDLKAALAVADDPWILANRATLDATLESIGGHLATIEISSNAPGATLRVNGAPSGPLPRALRVEAGTVVIDVEAPGFEAVHRSLDVAAKELVRAPLFLAPIQPAKPAVDAPPVAPPIAPPLAILGAPPAAPEAAASPARLTWGWIALGAAGVTLAGGIVATLDRQTRVGIYDDDARCPPGYKQALCGDQRDAAQTATVVAVVAYGATAALAATGIVLLATSRPSSVRVGAWALPNGAGATIGARF